MNCVARWEAEQYCAWAGKRLATADEWEYAARSGKEDYECPWGVAPASICNRSKQRPWPTMDAIRPVCTFPSDDSEQGVCDLASAMDELVSDGRSPVDRSCNDYSGPLTDYVGPTKLGYHAAWAPVECLRHFSRSPEVTFRCARDVPVSDSRSVP